MRETSDIDWIWNTFIEHDFFDDIVLDDTVYAESEEEDNSATSSLIQSLHLHVDLT